MDFSKIKNSKTLKWALIIGLPTVLVAGYFGYQYIKKKREESGSRLKLNSDGSVDTTGMDYYKITALHNAEVAGKIYDAILKMPYVPVGDIVIKNDKQQDIVNIEIMTKPEDAEKIKKILPIAGSDIKIDKITKEQSLTLPKEVSCTKHESTAISNINDFYEDAKCLEWTKMFGYDLLPLKDLPDIEKRVTTDELNKILGYAKIGATKLTDAEAIDFMKLMGKAYTPLKP
mgnify:CR=1 FL=1